MKPPQRLWTQFQGLTLISLLAAVLIPLSFNPWGFSPFELPKALLLRGLVLTGGLIVCIRLIDGQSKDRLKLKQRQWSPLTWPLLAFGLVLVLATLFSFNPHLSLWGSLERQQGLVTLLSYLALFGLTVTGLQRRTQVARLEGAIVWGSAPVVIYGLGQAAGLDPLVWQTDGASPIISTLGRTNFVGSYLVLVIPLTLGRFLRGEWRWATLLLGLGQLFCLGLTQVRAAWLGLAVALLIFGLIWTLRSHQWRRLAAILVLTGLSFGFVLLLNLSGGPLTGLTGLSGLDRLSQLSDTRSGSTAARLTIWQSTWPLILDRPWLGYGPETMRPLFARVYPPELVYYQGRDLGVDRAHNLVLDLAQTSGLAGLVTFTLVLVGFGRLAWRGLNRANGRSEPLGWIALIAAVVGHGVDLQFSFETTGPATLFWLVLALGVGRFRIQQSELDSGTPLPVGHPRPRSQPTWLPYLPPAGVLLVIIGLICARPLAADIALWQSQQPDLSLIERHRAALRAVRLWPFEVEYHFGLANLAGQRQHFATADRQFARALRLAPQDAQLWAGWGDVNSGWGRQAPQRYQTATTAYRRAIDLAPTIAVYHTRLGIVLARQGQLPQALIALERAINLDTTDVAAYDTLAELYQALGRESEAFAARQASSYWTARSTHN